MSFNISQTEYRPLSETERLENLSNFKFCKLSSGDKFITKTIEITAYQHMWAIL